MRTDDPEFWNQLYKPGPYAFGETANAFLRGKIEGLPPGKVLLPGEGEGRNAVFCAEKGWKVSAFDLSPQGKAKAKDLAGQHNVDIDYKVGDIGELTYPKAHFDALVMIFAQFMPEDRYDYHRKLLSFLKPGGFLILQGHARPKENEADMRYDVEELKEDFKEIRFGQIERKMTELNEGMVIQGPTEVVEIFGRKLN